VAPRTSPTVISRMRSSGRARRDAARREPSAPTAAPVRAMDTGRVLALIGLGPLSSGLAVPTSAARHPETAGGCDGGCAALLEATRLRGPSWNNLTRSSERGSSHQPAGEPSATTPGQPSDTNLGEHIGQNQSLRHERQGRAGGPLKTAGCPPLTRLVYCRVMTVHRGDSNRLTQHRRRGAVRR
jgi:hypothetical protein